MNIPFFCVFLVFILNYLTKIPLGMAMAKSAGGYNNREPREQQAALTGWGKRALGAHMNGFEIFPAFAAGVIMAHIAGVNQESLTLLSITFVASRVIYVGLYFANLSTLRSLVWGVGAYCVAALLWRSMFV